MKISDFMPGDSVYLEAMVSKVKDGVLAVEIGRTFLVLCDQSDLAPIQPVDAARIVAEQKEKANDEQ